VGGVLEVSLLPLFLSSFPKDYSPAHFVLLSSSLVSLCFALLIGLAYAYARNWHNRLWSLWDKNAFIASGFYYALAYCLLVYSAFPERTNPVLQALLANTPLLCELFSHWLLDPQAYPLFHPIPLAALLIGFLTCVLTCYDAVYAMAVGGKSFLQTGLLWQLLFMAGFLLLSFGRTIQLNYMTLDKHHPLSYTTLANEPTQSNQHQQQQQQQQQNNSAINQNPRNLSLRKRRKYAQARQHPLDRFVAAAFWSLFYQTLFLILLFWADYLPTIGYRRYEGDLLATLQQVLNCLLWFFADATSGIIGALYYFGVILRLFAPLLIVQSREMVIRVFPPLLVPLFSFFFWGIMKSNITWIVPTISLVFEFTIWAAVVSAILFFFTSFVLKYWIEMHCLKKIFSVFWFFGFLLFFFFFFCFFFSISHSLV
jgi:hypothetical protein